MQDGPVCRRAAWPAAAGLRGRRVRVGEKGPATGPVLLAKCIRISVNRVRLPPKSAYGAVPGATRT